MYQQMRQCLPLHLLVFLHLTLPAASIAAEPVAAGSKDPAGANAEPPAKPSEDTESRKGATAALDKKVAAWNRHDLEEVLAAYSDSTELSVLSTGSDLFGKEALKERYQQWYGKDASLMGKIGYSDLKSKVLDKNSVLLTGKYTLEEPNEKPVSGVFTLVYLHTEQNGWKIMHEHLSKKAAS